MTSKALTIGPRLFELETIIESSMAEHDKLGEAQEACRLEAGKALIEIRAHKLYRERGFKFFGEYLGERWGWSDSHGRHLIAAAKTVAIATVSGLPEPANVGQARELGKADDPAEVWAEVVEQHPPAEITAAVIREHVEARKVPVAVIEDAEVVTEEPPWDLTPLLDAIETAVREARIAGATTTEMYDAYQRGLQ